MCVTIRKAHDPCGVTCAGDRQAVPEGGAVQMRSTPQGTVLANQASRPLKGFLRPLGTHGSFSSGRVSAARPHRVPSAHAEPHWSAGPRWPRARPYLGAECTALYFIVLFCVAGATSSLSHFTVSLYDAHSWLNRPAAAGLRPLPVQILVRRAAARSHPRLSVAVASFLSGVSPGWHRWVTGHSRV